MRKTSATKRRPSEDAWVDLAAEAPRADLPDRQDGKRARRMRRYVKWSAILVPFMLGFAILAFAVAINALNAEEEVDISVESAATTESRAVAIGEVERWLSGEPSPLPDGVLLGWNYAQPVRSLAVENSDQLEPDMLSHNLSVASPAGTFSVLVVTTSSSENGVQLVASPSLEPYVPGETEYAGPAWPGAESVSPPEAVNDAINSWAQALTSGQPSSLRLAVGDPDANHSYMPLMGIELHDVRLEEVSAPPSQFDSEGRLTDDPEELIGRVEMKYEWLGTEDGDEFDIRPVTTYEVLVLRADTASPQVVAWGGPGSGPNLEPYSNAIVGRELVVVDPETGEDVELDEDGLDDEDSNDEDSNDEQEDEDED